MCCLVRLGPEWGLYSTLFGTVSSAETKAAADEKAKAVSGVKSVEDSLQVVRAAKQDTVAAKDDDVEDLVEAALGKQDDLKAAKIDVDEESGVARLTGTVPSQADRLRAALLTRTTSGVRAVKDGLRVEQD